MVKRLAYWIFWKLPRRRWSKMSIPFTNKKAAQAYVRWLKNNGFPRTKFRIEHSVQKIRKNMTIYSSAKNAKRHR